MNLKNLLTDAAECDPSASERAKHAALAEALNTKFPESPISAQGVAKWFERSSIPSKWLLRVASLPTPALNPSDYL